MKPSIRRLLHHLALSGESGSQRDNEVPANKPGTRTINGKAIVIELSGSDDEDDDQEDEVYNAADEGAAPASHLNTGTGQNTPAPEAAASRKRKSEKTSSVSSSLPSSRSLSEFRYTPDWLKNRDAEREPVAKEIEEKEEEMKEEKREPKEKKRKAKKVKKDQESRDDLSQIAGERPPRRPLPYAQDTGYITSGPLLQVEDPDPTPASFWQDKAPGVEDWPKNAE